MSDASATGTEIPDVAPPRWWESSLFLALVSSLFLHVLLALIATFVLVREPIAGELGGGTAEEFELAALSDDSLTELAAAPLASDALAVKPISDEQTFVIKDDTSLFGDAISLDAAAVDVSALSGSGGAAVGDQGLGLSGAGGEARFFGVEARGSRFAFVVDVSGSMLEPAKIGTLRAALIDAVDGLSERASFCIILYNADAIPLMTERWTQASEESKSAARRNIINIVPSGATNPLPALDIVFKLKPMPDGVYFMTDGMFSKDIEEAIPSLVQSVARRGDKQVPMHCITYVDRDSEKLMRRLARISAGSYTHVEGPRR